MSFPRYPAYRDSGVAWLGEVPEHWTVTRVDRVASCNDDVLSESTAGDTPMLYVDISGVDAVHGVTESEPMTFANAPSRARRLVRDGDVIISTVRTYLRAIAVLHSPHPDTVVSTGFAVLRARSVQPRFLGYWCRSSGFIDQVIARSTGVSYPAINGSELVRIPIALPSPDEQDTIATFLDHETARIDALVAEQERLVTLLREKRQAVISHAVTKGLDPNVPRKDSGVAWLGEVPEHWEVTRLRYVATCLDGQRVPLNAQQRAEIPGDVPYWGANAIQDYINDYIFDEELVLLGEDGAPFFDTLRPVAFTSRGRVWPNNHIHVLRVGAPALAPFLTHILNITSYAAFIDGSTRDKLTQGSMSDIPVLVPPTAEVDAILAFLDAETVRLDNLVTEAERAISLLRERRSALISAAVTGQIDVRGAMSTTAE